jgi:glycosyltransferase involved in cell wall biosynthesis
MQTDVLGCLAGRLTGTPWLLREPASKMGYASNWKIWLRIRMAPFSSAIVSNSQAGMLYWRSYLPKKPIYVIPNGLPIDEIEQAPPGGARELGLGPDQSMVLFVGRFDQQKYSDGLVHQKNLENLVAALLPVVTEPGVVGVLCGDGPRLPVIKQLVENLGIADRVFLPGPVANAWSLMKQAKVFVSVSHFEGHPNTVLEAMACGCPLVVSDIPEHREFLDEESALLVNPRGPAEISRAIKQTLTNPEEARRRARIAQQKAGRWTIAAMAQRYEEVYREVLQQAKLKGSARKVN